MQRLIPVVLAVFAVFALATVASSLDSVSTEPSIGTEEPTLEPKNASGGAGAGGSGGGTQADQREAPTELTSTPGDSSTTGPPLWQVVAGLALFLLGSVAALYGLTRGEDDGVDDAPSDPEPTAPPADRVTLSADVPATNDVYRTWAALCRAAPITPAGRTPAEVAEAAVGAGYGAAAVAELTDVFCVVRYGDAAATSERERRARELAAQLSLPTEGEP